jgi:hypothetical protein
MTSLVTTVMQSAAIKLLEEEADQIDQQVQGLLTEMERVPLEEEGRLGSFTQFFLELLKRRGEVAREALVVFKEPQSARLRTRQPIKSAIADFAS